MVIVAAIDVQKPPQRLKQCRLVHRCCPQLILFHAQDASLVSWTQIFPAYLHRCQRGAESRYFGQVTGNGSADYRYLNEELEEVGVGLELSLTKIMGAPRLMQLGGVNG